MHVFEMQLIYYTIQFVHTTIITTIKIDLLWWVLGLFSIVKFLIANVTKTTYNITSFEMNYWVDVTDHLNLDHYLEKENNQELIPRSMIGN